MEELKVDSIRQSNLIADLQARLSSKSSDYDLVSSRLDKAMTELNELTSVLTAFQAQASVEASSVIPTDLFEMYDYYNPSALSDLPFFGWRGSSAQPSIGLRFHGLALFPSS